MTSPGQVTSPCQGRRWTRSNTCCALMVAGCLLSLIWFRVNIEPSVPLGVYRLHAVQCTAHAGHAGAAAGPGQCAALACPWVPLLKPIAAVAGDVVCVDDDGCISALRRMAGCIPKLEAIAYRT